MVEIIRRNLISEEDPSKYKKGITHVTLDLLDYYADFATKILLDKIYFYDKFHPELFIKKSQLRNNNKEQSAEYLIPIEINIESDGIKYNEYLNWDLLDNELTPEKFAENTVKDENLPQEFIMLISYQIRKNIHNYVYDLFKNIVKKYEKYEQINYLGEDKITKTTRQSEDIIKNIPTFIFDAKLSKILGKKRKLNENNINEENLPSFLVNKKEEKEKNMNEVKRIKKMINSTKKIQIKKIKNNNSIEHDKQSTTMDENE
jgi:hypothetical protein